MRLMPWRTRTKRTREGGVAVIEFALSLFLLVPLLLAMLDYGYYFYVAENVVEAQRAGLLKAVKSGPVTDCTGGGTAALVNNAETAAANEAAAYMTSVGLTNVTLINATPACIPTTATPPSPAPFSWQMTLVGDFRPIIGYVAPWMKHSPTTGYARYTAHTLAMLGN